MERFLPGRRALMRLGVCLALASVLGSSNGAGAGVGTGSSERVSTKVVKVDVRGAHGSVVSVPRGIDCNPSCSAKFVEGTEVALVAGSRRASRFVDWKGDCVGQSVICVLFVDRTANVAARFEPTPGTDIGFGGQSRPWLYVTAPRRGGVIRSVSPTGISCPGTCKKRFKEGTPVTLRAYPKSGYTPAWESYPTGVCRAAADECAFTLRTETHVGVSFAKATR